MLRGHEHDLLYSHSIRNMFSVYFLGKRQSVLHPKTAQGSFFQLQSYSKKL